MNRLKEKIARAPDAPGVYSMRDKAGKVIYIGKAKSLQKRLASYLSRDLSAKTMALMSNVYGVDWQTCHNEGMALLLEASLVHKYKPKYNVSLRDDKSFPCVKITNEEFPAIYITRKKEDDGATYLGPYTNAKLLKQALKVIRRNFPYRSCKTLPSKACIYYRIGLSPAPCIGKISKGEYAKTIADIRLLLEGRTESLVKKLSAGLKEKARQLEFEEAAKIRDKISALSALGMMRGDFASRDELEDLQRLLGLAKLPQRIEAFDISCICGKEATGSMVSFWMAQPDKNNYRRFRIKAASGIDDYGMLKEVVRRRYARLLNEGRILPDLVLIDGGRGHLAAAGQEMRNLGLSLPLVSIAKEQENIYTKEKAVPIKLGADTPALNLIRRVRDEAHRFAVAYHHLLRRKKVIGR